MIANIKALIDEVTGRAQKRREAEEFAKRLAEAKTANEITSLIGLPPIKGSSGPKQFY